MVVGMKSWWKPEQLAPRDGMFGKCREKVSFGAAAIAVRRLDSGRHLLVATLISSLNLQRYCWPMFDRLKWLGLRS
jgi:hypothetical protein